MSEPEQYRPSRGFLTTLAVVIVAALALAGSAVAHHGQTTSDPPTWGYWLCWSYNFGGNCTATSSDDHVFGTPGADNLRGVNGNDYIEGLEGNDVLYGGNNRPAGVSGSIPHEEIRGGPGADLLYAGCPGGCTQNTEPDQIYGGTGNDVIRAENGKGDYVEGGAGTDTCYVEPEHDGWAGCEVLG